MRLSQMKGQGRLGAAMAAIGLAALGATAIVLAQVPFTPLPAGASVKIAAPADGAKVKSPVHFVFEVKGASIKPAGPIEAGTGHHHLLINMGSVPPGQAIPNDATHLHYGKGQTEANVELKPGEYTATLQFADGLHQSYGPSVAHTIKIAVE